MIVMDLVKEVLQNLPGPRWTVVGRPEGKAVGLCAGWGGRRDCDVRVAYLEDKAPPGATGDGLVRWVTVPGVYGPVDPQPPGLDGLLLRFDPRVSRRMLSSQERKEAARGRRKLNEALKGSPLEGYEAPPLSAYSQGRLRVSPREVRRDEVVYVECRCGAITRVMGSATIGG